MKVLFKYLLFFSLLVCVQEVSAQQLIMEMIVTDEGKKLPGAEIKVFKNGSLVETVLTDAKGRADIPMAPNGNYTIEIGGNKGMIKKKLAVNTNNIPAEAGTGDIFYPAEVEIFKSISGLDLSILDKPIGKIFYDPEYGDFGADRQYTKQVQKDLEKLKDDFLAQKSAEEASMKQKQKDYDAAIKIADKAFADEDWEKAEQEYKKAQALMPIETYPSFQLAELETKLIKIREDNKKYDEAIAKADAALAAKNYEQAIAEYGRASGYKPDKAYPKDKLKEVQDLLANAAKVEQSYLAAIEKGDNALKINDLNTAKAAFEEASGYKPEEIYPKNKLAEIADVLAKQSAKEEEYKSAIKEGDDALAAKNYEEAKSAYERALKVKPTEAYPKDQITKVTGLMAEAAKKEQEYLTAIEKGDNALAANNYQEAKTAFESASQIKPEEVYPKDKIKEIDDFIAKNEAAEKAYQDKISEADKAFTAKDYETAKAAYQEAQKLKPTEGYPQEKITEIDGLIAKAEQLEADYQSAITRGDEALAKEEMENAKAAYNEALSLKPEEKYPKDKLSEIETITLKNQQNEEKYNTAIQNGDDALADKNYEKAKEFYNEALSVKADEQYPKDKITEIDGLIAAEVEKEKSYNDALAAADDAMGKSELEEAKKQYLKALSIKPEETYPQEQLSKIDEQIANNEKLEADYQAAVKEGDDAFANKDYEKAKTAFEKALGLKSTEEYPKSKITEIEGLIAELEKQEESYSAAIQKGDAALADEKWEEAKSAFEEALSIKEDEYPKSKIAEIDAKLSEIAAQQEKEAKLEADYQAAIADGDKNIEAKKYDEAKLAFNRALELKPDESYPKEKIEEIDNQLEKLAAEQAEKERLEALQKEYDDLIKKADESLAGNQLENAKTGYEAALQLKPEEAYPKTKIDEINASLADAAQKEESYTQAIAKADELLASESFEEAKNKYVEASEIKPSEQYPKDKIKEVEEKLAQIAAEQEEIRLQNEKEAELEKQYRDLVDEADDLLSEEKYEEAKSKYNEALAVKDDQYPKDKISEIEAAIAALADQAAADAAAAEQAKIEAEYQALVTEADGLMSEEKYEEAKSKYNEALAVKDDQYPKDKISEIEAAIAALADQAAADAAAAEQARIEAEYQTLISEADDFLAEEKYKEAKAKFEAALVVKEQEQYPKDKLTEIEVKLKALANAEAEAARLAKLETDYLVAIEKGDNALSGNNLQEALTAYKNAQQLKPSETYPANKIQEIEGLIAKESAAKEEEIRLQNEQYSATILEAETALNSKAYDKAIGLYEKALTIKPNETLPKDEIEKIKAIQAQLLAAEEAERLRKEQAAANESSYQTAIANGDRYFSEGDYNAAENEYRLALSLKPEESYPQAQLDKINNLIEEQRQKELAAQEAKNKEAQAEAAYNAFIESGDAAIASKNYRKAKSDFEQALSLKPQESYPKEQLKKIKQLIEEERLAEEQRRKDLDKPIEIKKGPKATITDDAEKEIERMYQEMWAKRNSNKNAVIEKKTEVLNRLREENRERELARRQNAIERIEAISITVQEQGQLTNELNLQNYEIIKEKEVDLREVQQELEREAERRRNNNASDNSSLEEQIATFKKLREEETIEGKKLMVENEYDEMKVSRETRTAKQFDRTKKVEEEYVQKEEEIKEFNQKRAKETYDFNNQRQKEVEENWNTTIIEYRASSDLKLEEEKSRLEKDTEELRNTENQNFKDADERIQEQQERVNDQETEIRQFKESNSESFKNNQLAVEEKEKAVTEANKELVSKADTRIQENSKEEFYAGEKKIRQDPKSAEYPQGITEEIIENQNNSTTIRRIVVEGTQTDIYEKTLYAWGGIFYTKNGNNISKETWDKESK